MNQSKTPQIYCMQRNECVLAKLYYIYSHGKCLRIQIECTMFVGNNKIYRVVIVVMRRKRMYLLKKENPSKYSCLYSTNQIYSSKTVSKIMGLFYYHFFHETFHFYPNSWSSFILTKFRSSWIFWTVQILLLFGA